MKSLNTCRMAHKYHRCLPQDPVQLHTAISARVPEETLLCDNSPSKSALAQRDPSCQNQRQAD